MKRIALFVIVLAATLALTPRCDAVVGPVAVAHGGCSRAASVVPAAATAGFAAWLQAQTAVPAAGEVVPWQPVPQNTPCFKCFSLGVDCCTTPSGGTVCCA